MKFRCPREVWVRGISAVQNAVGSPISNPIVENILVSCENQKVSFFATNLTLAIRCERDADVEEEGSIVLPTKVIIGLVRDLPPGEVTFECSETDVVIRCGRFFGKMKGQPGEQFPPFMPSIEGKTWSIPADMLRSAIRRTIFATSAEKSRFELDGIKIDFRDGKTFFVATDGRRLAQVVYDNPDSSINSFGCLVPTKTMAELLNSLPEEGEAQIVASERRVLVSCGDLTVASNLLTDKFPPYEKIIPKDAQFTAIVPREPFLDMVKRVSDLSDLETSLVILELDKGSLKVHGERAEVGGRGEEDLEVEYSGDPMELRYNYRFLIDILRVLDTEKVVIELWDESRPGLIRGLGMDNYLYVIMPMRRPEEANVESE